MRVAETVVAIVIAFLHGKDAAPKKSLRPIPWRLISASASVLRGLTGGALAMFGKILIANRGEIACRIIRTARAMGIETVAVYSEADRRALHVEMADEAVAIGPAPAAESYLRIEAIVKACQATGAEAVHPGYGFLSENAKFPDALAQAGIVFIGPHAKAIRAMGDKISSKTFAAKAKVSTVPGHIGIVEDETDAAQIAEKIGFPVMIKASAGGGGRGMRIAHSAAEVEDGFRRARSEAQSSFGDDRVFLEKFIENPRHIEIQVLGDKHGNVIHLGERECSIQRRNQKVIEEAPSPLLDPETRSRMGAQAIALAKAVGYDSAGTVEFVAAQDKSFYFLEMNTRLQVEHPVTELVTGIDLVEHMIRVAAGEPLAIRQSDVKLNGWAIETRIYAEDPYRNFMPSSGRLVRYRPPEQVSRADATIRNDTGVYEGGEISVYYDPMIAKLCTHGPSRAAAIDLMADALDSFVIDGIQHNVAFLAAVMGNERWRSGRLSTGFIDEEFPNGFVGGFTGTDAEAIKQRLVTVAAALDHVETRRRHQISGQLAAGRMVAWSPVRVVRLGAEWHEVELAEVSARLVRVVHAGGAGERMVESDWTPGMAVWHGRIDGEAISVQVRSVLNGYRLSHRGVEIAAHVHTPREAELAKIMPEQARADTSKTLLCPMPGLVVSINVEPGQDVKTGEALCVVEAMKMENILRAERDVTVKAIHAGTGDSLAVDAVIMEFE
jgi:propionyl-CoA carboxylase alpha chain